MSISALENNFVIWYMIIVGNHRVCSVDSCKYCIIDLWGILVNRSKRSVSKIHVLGWVCNSTAYGKR